ncbi:MAG: exosome complex exonuclease Rrp41 [Candidatus Aenigmarchaeota archaeon]|nr:exosome complex exonuclease Rrp41 [Candidatus Aenigmarchaeota archaeon]
MKKKSQKKVNIVEFKRIDGRKHDEFRPIEARVGVLQKADGSAYFRLGNTVAIAGVYGPRKVHPRHEEQLDRAILRTRYNMAPFATTERGRPGYSRRSIEISMVTRQAINPVIFLEEFPKTAIDVHIEVLQADASTRCVGINAACLALADAGIPMRDLVASCSAGKVNGNIILDIAGKEDTEGEVDLPVAYYPKKKHVTLLQMDGIVTREEAKEIVKLAVGGTKKIYEAQKSALRKKYEIEGEKNDIY